MPRLARALQHAQSRYDVVIVGSGYGGGVSASRLARAGKRVAVLERGREVATGEFPAKFPELRAEMRVTGTRFRSGSETALYDVRLGDDMHVLVGCGLGGGSLVNAGVSLRPDARVFADPVWPGQIRQDGLLDEGFRRAERWLRPVSDPRAGDLPKFRALAAAGAAVGASPVAPRVAVSFEDTVNQAGIPQSACTRCGDCCAGCNVGAKNTVAQTYLPDAVAHGAELFTHARVSHVGRGADGDWVVHVDEVGSAADARRTITAAVVILSAGTLGSTEILLRSREHGLAVSDRLGQRFSANGDIIAFGYGANIPVGSIGVGYPAKGGLPAVGASVSGQLEIKDAADLASEVCIQEGAVPSAMAPILPVMFVPNGRLLGALQSLVSGVYKGPFASMQTFFAVSHDSASGRFSLANGQLSLAWPGAKDEPVYRRLDELLGRLVTGVGGAYVKNPLAGTVMGHQPATAHPLGGVAMATDGDSGAISHKGELFSGAGSATHKGLYVVDGSIVPRSLGVNPLLTITALAERAMLHMAQDHNLSFQV